MASQLLQRFVIDSLDVYERVWDLCSSLLEVSIIAIASDLSRITGRLFSLPTAQLRVHRTTQATTEHHQAQNGRRLRSTSTDTSAHGAVARRGVPAATGGQGEHTQGGAQAHLHGQRRRPASIAKEQGEGRHRRIACTVVCSMATSSLMKAASAAATLTAWQPICPYTFPPCISLSLPIFPAAVVLEETLAMPTSGSACQLSEPQSFGRCPRLRCHAGQTLNAC